jgi:hypothetical protein
MSGIRIAYIYEFLENYLGITFQTAICSFTAVKLRTNAWIVTYLGKKENVKGRFFQELKI